MNATGIKMVQVLRELKGTHAVVGVKAEFEAEGTRTGRTHAAERNLHDGESGAYAQDRRAAKRSGTCTTPALSA